MSFDEKLAEGVRSGDPDALAALWRILAPALVRYLTAQAQDHHLAEDLAQDTFLELVRACGSIEGGPSQIQGWLYRAAYRNLLDHRRHAARRWIEFRPDPPERPSPARTPGQAAEDADLAAHLDAALDRLTPNQRAIVALRFLDDLSAAQIAGVLGMTEGGVRSLQHRGLAALARLLRSGAVPVPG